MLDADDTGAPDQPGDTSGGTPATPAEADQAQGQPPAKKAAKKTAKKAPAKKAPAKKAPATKAAKKTAEPTEPTESTESTEKSPAKKAAKRTAAKSTAKKTTRSAAKKAAEKAEATPEPSAETAGAPDRSDDTAAESAGAAQPAVPLFQPPEPVAAAPRRKEPAPDQQDQSRSEEPGSQDEDDEHGAGRRRRRRGGRRRRKSGEGGEGADQAEDGATAQQDVQATSQQESKGKGGKTDKSEKSPKGKAADKQTRQEDAASEEKSGESESSSRRRRRRRRTGEGGDSAGDDPEKTVTKVRKGRSPEDEITALTGSTRLEAKKQRRREGREAGRRRAPIVSEAEFLARREAVDRVMVIRQRKDLTQIAVLEDDVLVEHYVARESQTSLIGNVYLGRVQNVLPSMEAAFIDIGKGRNAVLYAGEVNWDALGAGNGPRKIEQVLKSGQSVLVQVTKDPVGHKGARLTSQVSLPGRFLVYVPDGTTSGISRKLPDTERNRLKSLLKEIVPDSAGVIVRTAAEGASEEELTRDVQRLTARWDDIAVKVEKSREKPASPQLLYGEPDLTLKVVRDLFTEDFKKLVVSGDDAWDMVEGYVQHVAPDLAERLERFDGDAEDVFASYRIDEQIAKSLERKVWLPSGGSLILDRTEAMTVVDVNTGKFTGSGGNLEETVTKNNLEAAEEIVRQLRLRDIGGIVVIDFIDMVLESNRDLVLRRLVECLGRDRTRHQVAEVTSLGLVQMTRKRIGTGLLEAFSEPCEHCGGRGLVVHHEPVEPKKRADEEPRRGRRGGRGRGRGGESHQPQAENGGNKPSPKAFAAMAGTDAKPEADEDHGTPSGAGHTDTRSDGQPSGKAAGRHNGAGASEATPAEPEPEAQESATPQEAEPAEPSPKLVTSSRRRRASRPAGPPAGSDDVPLPGVSDDAVGKTGESTGGAPGGDTTGDGAAPPKEEPAPAAHVPVKKKGSRKK